MLLKGKKHWLKNSVFQVLLSLVILEILLRIFNINQTYSEKHNNQYQPFFGLTKDSWFHVWPTNTDLEFGGDEFTYLNHYNDLGHREIDFNLFKDSSSSIKIICLGDSFTEGDGAPYDSSWVRFFEKQFTAQIDSNALVYNAGVCGSDALYNHVMLREKLIKTNPDIVIECINSSDILDIYYRGGVERFNDDGTLEAKNKKKWELFYEHSYLFRAFFVVFSEYDNKLVNRSSYQLDKEKALRILANQIVETNELCEKNNSSYYLTIMPIPNEVNSNSFRYTSSSLISEHGNPLIDLLPKLPANIKVININPCMDKVFNTLDMKEYSWEKNAHYNSLGYNKMAECIFDEFKAQNCSTKSYY